MSTSTFHFGLIERFLFVYRPMRLFLEEIRRNYCSYNFPFQMLCEILLRLSSSFPASLLTFRLASEWQDTIHHIILRIGSWRPRTLAYWPLIVIHIPVLADGISCIQTSGCYLPVGIEVQLNGIFKFRVHACMSYI
jgi:hypothetical protein